MTKMRDPKIKAIKANRRQIKINAIKSEFRKIPLLLSGRDMGEKRDTIPELSMLPREYKKIIDHLGIASPKTRRIACRIICLSQQVNYVTWIETLSQTFFDSQGRLKQENMDVLFGNFHGALETAAKSAKTKEWISLAQMIELTKKHNN